MNERIQNGEHLVLPLEDCTSLTLYSNKMSLRFS